MLSINKKSTNLFLFKLIYNLCKNLMEIQCDNIFQQCHFCYVKFMSIFKGLASFYFPQYD
jgi:hypothetical protein